MAKRLVRLPLIKRQKAFLPRDSIAENAFIIEHLIKVAKARKDDLFLVFMDVAKAFDLVVFYKQWRGLVYQRPCGSI